MLDFFNDLEEEYVSTNYGELRLRRGGTGPAVLLLHGNPQTHAMWHAVAPFLMKQFTCVCPDLPGYGRSFKPALAADHLPSSKREVAKPLVALMAQLGFERFAVVGHDRGARVGHRLTLDYPDKVTHFAALDIVPTLAHFERADMAFGLGYYHWFWFAQPHPFPENIINQAPLDWFRAHTSREPKDADFFNSQALADYHACIRDPAMISGMCEDYRAAASIDLTHDRNSRANGHRIRCDLLALWGDKGKIGGWYEPLAVWRSFAAANVSGFSVDSGHYLPEEQPTTVASALEEFLRR